MKRIIILALIMGYVLPLNAETFFEVEWSEFCPKKYANIDPNKWHYTSNGRYWAGRRKTFEKRLERCKSLPDERQDACFSALRELEMRASEAFNSDKQNKILRRMLMNSVF